MRVVVGIALAATLLGCARPPMGRMTIVFDHAMVPEDVTQTLRHCGVHDDVYEGPSLSLWQIEPNLSRRQIACLDRQPHVVGVEGAM